MYFNKFEKLIFIHLFNIFFSYHVPEVRIVTCEPLRLGKTSELLLKFCNPTQHQSQIILFPVETPTTPTTITATGEKVEVKRETMQLVRIFNYQEKIILF